MVVLERDADRLDVDVVLEVAADVAVVVDGIPLDQNVAAGDGVGREHEEAVAVVVHVAVADGDVLAELDVDRRRRRGVGLGGAARAGERVRIVRAADFQVLDDDPLRHHRRAIGERHDRRTDLDHAAHAARIIELRACGRAVAVEDRTLSVRAEDAADRHRRGRRPDRRDDELLFVWRGTVVDEHGVASGQRLERDVADVRVGLPRAHFECRRCRGMRERHRRRQDAGYQKGLVHRRLLRGRRGRQRPRMA